MSNRAWVTLATNDSYGLGALVLAHSLRRANTAYPTVVLVTPSVTDAMRNRLSAVFAEVITVDVLDSRDATHLALLQRPELGITFTKIHCWSLTQYQKCVFLDADTLIVQNCDELFEREELSAAPDVGWPDCFNSGVFVFVPSSETYSRLITFAQERGSFDGGDQGLLNAFFSDWAHGDINKHLPFLYNVTSAAFYSYIPALKHYGQDLKIIHFIGAAKPWLQHFNWDSRSVDAPEHLSQFLQSWWDIFVGQVHSQLDSTMSGVAGNLARVTPGAGSYQREAIDELTRRQGWEAGNIDYMGADSFDNIWAKISQTLNQPRVSPPKQPSPPRKEPTPPKEETQPQVAPAAPAPVAAPAAVETPAAEVPVAPTTAVPEVVSVAAAPEAAPVAAAPEAPVAAAVVETAAAPVAETPVAAEAPAPPTEAAAQSAVEPAVAPVVETPVASVPETTAVPAAEAPAAPTTEAPAAPVPEAPIATAPVVSAPSATPEASAAPAAAEVPKEVPVVLEQAAQDVSTPAVAEVPTTVVEALASEQAPAAAAPEAKEKTATEAPAAEAAAEVSTKVPSTPPPTPAAASDSPPLANTPSKEEAPAVPAAAKSEERRKPAGKLQLSPPGAGDALPTPDSELEDAAALAQSIINSELRLLATAPSPAADPASPPALQHEQERLSVEPPQVPTPPVSLAQIGVKPKEKATTAEQIESSLTEKSASAPVAPTPVHAAAAPTPGETASPAPVQSESASPAAAVEPASPALAEPVPAPAEVAPTSPTPVEPASPAPAEVASPATTVVEPASPAPAEPASPSTAEPAAPGEAPKKKVVKKGAKKEAAPSGDAATPVPPPRKKEKKPKEK